MSVEEKKIKYEGDIDDDDALMRHTQHLRIAVIDQLMDQSGYANDPKAVGSLQKMMDGIDKQVLGKRRAAAADKSNAINSDLANTLNEWVTQKAGARIQRHDEAPETGYRPPAADIPSVAHGEGELAPVGELINVEDIMKAAFASRRPVDDED